MAQEILKVLEFTPQAFAPHPPAEAGSFFGPLAAVDRLGPISISDPQDNGGSGHRLDTAVSGVSGSVCFRNSDESERGAL